MKYPYRVKIEFPVDERGRPKPNSKLATIFKINRFMISDVKGEYAKYNWMQRDDVRYDSVFKGIEIAFADNKDAVHFKLGFISDGEKVTGDIYQT